MPEALGQDKTGGKLCGEGEMDVTLSETGWLWWLLQKKQEQKPLPVSQNALPSLNTVDSALLARRPKSS